MVFGNTLLYLVKFSPHYADDLHLREKEKRVLTIKEIKELPYINVNSSDYELWKIRQKNIERFIKYIKGKNKSLRILDIGCGNGFFTYMLSKPNNVVIGVDVNLTELKLAKEAFPEKNINWYYLDIIEEKLPEEKFDIITFCASFQYFNEPKKLLQICKSLLSSKGEIHIIDSPFYSEKEKHEARLRSLNHFKALNEERMLNYYHHNSYEVLNECNYSFKYKPNYLLNKLLFKKDSPFPWIKIDGN